MWNVIWSFDLTDGDQHLTFSTLASTLASKWKSMPFSGPPESKLRKTKLIAHQDMIIDAETRCFVHWAAVDRLQGFHPFESV